MVDILLVDQTLIPVSMDCISLFVNQCHILDSDDQDPYSINDIAEKLSHALSSPVRKIVLKEIDLALTLAEQAGQKDVLVKKIAGGQGQFDDWVQRYTNDDVLLTVSRLYPQSEAPLGLSEALEKLEDNDFILFEVEVGLYNLIEDINTPTRSFLVVVAALDPTQAAELAVKVCTETIPVVPHLGFSVMNPPAERLPTDYAQYNTRAA